MNIDNIGIGIDIEENNRFEGKNLKDDEKFLRKIFTQNELEYCFSHKLPHLNLCARFCAKEAITKALYSLDIKDVSYNDIEIINRDDGCPFVNLIKYPALDIKISLSHNKNYSTANALIIKI